MDEREKIISIIRPIIKEQYLMRCKEPDGCDNCWISCSVNERAKALADALIAANIGDVTEWKERAKKHRVQVLPDGTLKQLYGDEEVEQIVKERDSKEEAYNKCYFDYRYWKDKAKEYKHRAEVAEKERNEWKERAEKAENTLKEGVKCISPLQSAGFTINPIDVLRDSTKCITIAQRALENIIKQYWCDDRGCNECEEKQGCIEGICLRYIQQAEREIEEEKGE